MDDALCELTTIFNQAFLSPCFREQLVALAASQITPSNSPQAEGNEYNASWKGKSVGHIESPDIQFPSSAVSWRLELAKPDLTLISTLFPS
jgi:hypothetical protein